MQTGTSGLFRNLFINLAIQILNHLMDTVIIGTFGTAQLLSFPDNYSLNSISADGQTAYLGYNGDIYVSQIPEPVTLILLGLGGVIIRKRG